MGRKPVLGIVGAMFVSLGLSGCGSCSKCCNSSAGGKKWQPAPLAQGPTAGRQTAQGFQQPPRSVATPTALPKTSQTPTAELASRPGAADPLATERNPIVQTGASQPSSDVPGIPTPPAPTPPLTSGSKSLRVDENVKHADFQRTEDPRPTTPADGTTSELPPMLPAPPPLQPTGSFESSGRALPPLTPNTTRTALPPSRTSTAPAPLATLNDSTPPLPPVAGSPLPQVLPGSRSN